MATAKQKAWQAKFKAASKACKIHPPFSKAHATCMSKHLRHR